MSHSRRRARKRPILSSGHASAVVRSLAFLGMIAACVLALRWISNKGHAYVSQWGAPPTSQSFQFSDGRASYGIQPRNRRLVYPYSVIPGGVRSSDELREIVKHDPVVAQHYSGFDYARAHLIEVELPKLVYVSYRRGAQVHWSSKQLMLRVGEKLLTDGHITARARCGNQVSVLPQSNTLPDEPTVAELERPDAVASGREELFPQSAHALNLDPIMTLSPPYAGFPQPGPFMPFPFGGGPGPTPSGCVETKKHADSKAPKPNCTPTPPPPTVPEPSSLVLVFSGVAALYARVRRRRS